MAFSLGGALTGPVGKALLVLNPYRYGIQSEGDSSVLSTFTNPAFLFDLAREEGFEQTAEVTEYAIQDGSTTSDHIHFNLGDGYFTGNVSNHSIYAPPILDPTGLLQADRFKSAFDDLDRVYKKGERVTVYTVMKKYEGVLITSLNYDRDNTSGQAQDFNISFRETNIVSPKGGVVTVNTDVSMTNPDNRQAAPLANLGSL